MARFQFRAHPDHRAQPDDAVGDLCAVDDAAVGDERVVNVRAVDLGAGQITRPRKDRCAHVEEIEARQFGDEIQVRLEERAMVPTSSQ